MTQKTRADVLTAINTLLADNITQDISPADIRSVLVDMLDSYYSILDEDAITGLDPELTATPAAATNTDFTDIDGTSHIWRLRWSGLTTSVDGAEVWLRTSSNNGVSFDSAAQDYERALFGADANGTEFNDSSNNATEIIIARNVGNGSLESSNGYVDIYVPANTTLATHIGGLSFNTNNLDEPELNIEMGVRDTAGLVDAVRVTTSSGTHSGNFALYKLRTT